MSNPKSAPVPDPAAIWWGPTFHDPAVSAALREIPHGIVPARVGVSLACALLSLVIPIAAPVAWAACGRELARMRRGEVTRHGREWLLLGYVVAMIVTCMIALALVLTLVATLRVG